MGSHWFRPTANCLVGRFETCRHGQALALDKEAFDLLLGPLEVASSCRALDSPSVPTRMDVFSPRTSWREKTQAASLPRPLRMLQFGLPLAAKTETRDMCVSLLGIAFFEATKRGYPEKAIHPHGRDQWHLQPAAPVADEIPTGQHFMLGSFWVSVTPDAATSFSLTI